MNRDGLGLGREDVPLTALGEAQLAAAAASPALSGVRHVYTSPLLRARTGAELIAGRTGAAVESRDELTELDVGLTEGIPFAEIAERFPDFMRDWRGPGAAETRMPGGESLRDVALRLEPFLRQLSWDGGDVAVVSHNFVIRVAVCSLLGLGLDAFRLFYIDLASITTLSGGGAMPQLRRLNDTCHLQ